MEGMLDEWKNTQTGEPMDPWKNGVVAQGTDGGQ